MWGFGSDARVRVRCVVSDACVMISWMVPGAGRLQHGGNPMRPFASPATIFARSVPCGLRGGGGLVFSEEEGLGRGRRMDGLAVLPLLSLLRQLSLYCVLFTVSEVDASR